MRVVLDTNVWLSALVYSPASGTLRKILDHFEDGGFHLVTSPELVDEFIEVFDRHLISDAIKHKWVNLLKRSHVDSPPYVHHVEPKNEITTITVDPDDNRVLECAAEGRANFIVTGDKHLLKLERFQDIAILSPRDFLKRLDKES